MCNCGNKRSGLEYVSLSGSVDEPDDKKPLFENKLFEYVGKTALTVRGSISGTTYRFTHQGDKVYIDYRDVNGMMAVPNIRNVKE